MFTSINDAFKAGTNDFHPTAWLTGGVLRLIGGLHSHLSLTEQRCHSSGASLVDHRSLTVEDASEPRQEPLGQGRQSQIPSGPKVDKRNWDKVRS